VTALALAAAGQLVSIGDDGTVRVWEPDPLALMRGFAAEPNPRPRMEVVAHALVDGGRAIAIGTGLAVLEVFDLASARRRVRIELPAPLAAVAASPDGEWMATALQDGSVLVYSASGEIIGRREFPGVPRQIVVVGAHEIAVRDRGARLHGLVVRG
jgi:hypothetical protein